MLMRHRGSRVGSVVVMFLAVQLCDCGRGQADQSASDLDVQVQGWWLTPQTGACYCPPQPECTAGDCVSYSVIGLLADKRYYDGRISVSKTTGTMSTMGTLSSGTYRVDTDSVTISQPGVKDVVLPAAVQNGQLTLGSRIDARAPADLASALAGAAATRGARWSEYPLSR